MTFSLKESYAKPISIFYLSFMKASWKRKQLDYIFSHSPWISLKHCIGVFFKYLVFVPCPSRSLQFLWTAVYFSSSLLSSFSRATRALYWALDSISSANWFALASRFRNSSELSLSKGTLNTKKRRHEWLFQCHTSVMDHIQLLRKFREWGHQRHCQSKGAYYHKSKYPFLVTQNIYYFKK